MSVIGLDLGTSGVRAVAYAVGDGRRLAAASRRVTLHRSEPLLAEIDLEDAWAAVRDTVCEVAATTTVRSDPVRALAMSVQGEAVVPLDPDGRPLARVPVSVDGRAGAEAHRIGQAVGVGRLQALTGQRCHPMYAIAKIAWWQRLASVWGGAATFHCLGDAMLRRMGVDPAIDLTMAARTMACDVGAREWSHEVLHAAGVDQARMPRIVEPGTPLGRLPSTAAAELGLTGDGTEVVAGAHDQACAFWGAGGLRPGDAVASFGSSECVTVASHDPRAAVAGTGLCTYPTGSKAPWLILAGSPAGGWVAEWWARICAPEGSRLEELLDELPADPPALLFVPHLAGGGTLDIDRDARGAVVGLRLETTRPQLTRALVEASGYEVARVVAALRSAAIPLTELRVTGGGAAHQGALRVRASAAGLSLRPVGGHAAARGAAMLAAVGAGFVGSINGALGDVPPGPAITPEPQSASWYASQRSTYADLITVLQPTSRALATDPGATL